MLLQYVFQTSMISSDAKPLSHQIVSLLVDRNVRLYLFNHVLALFHDKFACNLVIRYHIFRWELCKGSV